MAYFGDYDGTIFGLNIRTKKIVWKIPGNEQSGSILAVPAVGNNYVVIGNEDKYLYCYNAIRWKINLEIQNKRKYCGFCCSNINKSSFYEYGWICLYSGFG